MNGKQRRKLKLMKTKKKHPESLGMTITKDHDQCTTPENDDTIPRHLQQQEKANKEDPTDTWTHLFQSSNIQFTLSSSTEDSDEEIRQRVCNRVQLGIHEYQQQLLSPKLSADGILDALSSFKPGEWASRLIL